MKPLPYGVCQKLPKPVPTCCPLRVEQLSFLSRRNPTVGSPTNLERRRTLTLQKWENKLPVQDSLLPHILFFFSFCLSSFLYLISFSHHFFFSFLFIFLPIFSSFFAFLSSFLNHYTYETKMRKFPPHLPQTK